MSEMKRILERIKFWMEEYIKENGPIHDDEYDKIFVRYYLKVSNEIKNSKNPGHHGWCSVQFTEYGECDCS